MDRKKLTEQVKNEASKLGADIVGVAAMDRFEGAPPQMDPRFIMPEAKSCIAVGFRVLRGSLRGIEEGTFFSNYSSMGYGGITYLLMPITVVNLAKYIEDMGYEALPMGHQSDWRAIDNEGKPTNSSRPVEPGKPAPDVMVHLRLAAFAAGLGEIGWSKMLITPEFGPAVRVGMVFTELDLEPDPIYSGPKLCNKCMACVKECPAGAFSTTRSVKVTVAGHQLEWSDIDCKACGFGFVGAARAKDPHFEGNYIDSDKSSAPSPISPFYHKPRNLYNTGQAVCGARGCTRACLNSLEKRDVLSNKFHKPFKRRKPWSVDWSDYIGRAGYLESNKDCDVEKKLKID